MNLSEDQFEVIEAYLTGELSAADQARFEAEVRANPEFGAEVDRQRQLRLGLRALGIERTLVRTRTQYRAMAGPPAEAVRHTPTVVRPLTAWRYWAAAASVILVLGMGYYAYQQQTHQRANMAYAETFTPDPTDQLLKEFPTGTVSPAVRTQFLDALTNYKAGKYDQVIGQLRTLPADKQTIHYKNYFLGLSYLANQQPTEAIPLLSRAQAAPSPNLRQKAEWFLALAYVKLGQNEKARPTLNRISADKANPFNALARQVLQRIR